MRAAQHHLIGAVDPSEAFSPARFRAEAEAIVAAHPGEGFLVVGGTGLYLKEWMHPSAERADVPAEIRDAAERELNAKGLATAHAELSARDPDAMAKVDPNDRHRILKRLENWLFTGSSYVREEAPLNPLFEGVPVLWLHPSRDALHHAIESRVKRMFTAGWADEVRRLSSAHDPETTPAFNALGYRELAEALQSGRAPETALEVIVARTRQYAKKQVTFFRHQFARAQAFDPADLAARLEAAEWDAKGLNASSGPATA